MTFEATRLNYDRLNKERITKTEIKPFHMITAVTQRAINKQLEKMHKVNPTLRKLDLPPLDEDDDYSSLTADLDAPTVVLPLGPENQSVIFCFNIKQGTLKYLKPKGRKTEEKEAPLTAGVLALGVNLKFEGADFKDLPKDVQKRLKVKEDYSVQQLLVDFTSADLSRVDKHRSTIHHQMSDEVKTYFNLFMESYFNILATKHAAVLHYLPLASTEKRKKYAMPTVPPTDFTFQNFPFMKSDRDKRDSEVGDDTMLIYTQMTGNIPLPSESLKLKANWVVPTPTNEGRYDGTVALSRDIFLDGWLLPKLADFNRESTFVVTKAKFEVDAPKYWVYFEGGLGQYEKSDEEVSFKSIDEDKVDKKVRELLNPQTPGCWYKYEDSNDKDDKGGLGYVKFEGKTKNYLFVPEGYNSAGKCEILLAGETRAWFRIKVDLAGSDGLVVGRWNTSIILDGINDGELIIKVNDIKPQFKETIDPAWFHKDETCSWVKTLRNAMDKLNMTDLVNQMRNVFGGGWDFVIPGAADFYIHRAVFNREEDLLCELKYKFQA